MKKFVVAALSALLAVSAVAAVPVFAADVQTYTLNDEFGIAPLARTFSQEIVREELNNELSGYSEYGYAAHLTSESGQRGYITYDVDGVVGAEVTALVAESNFGANHGWGVSLGVTDTPSNAPTNNINNIDLNNIYPMYLSKDGRPFLFYENRFWGYIADPKFSFIPSSSSSDPGTQLREFTVPDEVQGVYEEDGMTVVTPGFLYPMINLEYCTADSEEWIPMSLSTASGNYAITAAEFVGADKMYNVTVSIKNIPEDAVKVRIGANYIRETIKPSSSGDIEADIYTAFPRKPEESLFVTGVKLTLDTEYTGGYEEAEQTGIEADTSAATRYYAFGEQFDADGLVFYDVYNDSIREQNNDISAFMVDSSAFDPYQPGIYSIKVKKGNFETAYNVQVVKPSRLDLDTSALALTIEAGNTFSAEGLKVTAVSTVPQRGEISVELSDGQYTVDASAVKTDTAGTYQVVVTVGEGSDAVSTSFDVIVNGESGSGAGGCSGSVAGIAGGAGIAVVAAAAAVLILKRKHA